MIRNLVTLTFILLVASIAKSEPASETSIREILRVTEARKLVEGMFAQVDAMLKGSMQQAIGRALTADEQRVADRLAAKMSLMMKEEVSWENLEPLYLRIYRDSFTQEEVDGMLSFYRSAAGEALIKKMPMVMHQSMLAMQERMGPMMRKIQRSIEETVAEIKASDGTKN
jgi:hypothetical protein